MSRNDLEQMLEAELTKPEAEMDAELVQQILELLEEGPSQEQQREAWKKIDRKLTFRRWQPAVSGLARIAAVGGRLGITFKAVGTGICNQIGVASYHVQKQTDEGKWEDVSGLLAGQTGSNVVSYTFGRYFQGMAGETYRIQVTFVCCINNGIETKSYTSGRVTVK